MSKNHSTRKHLQPAGYGPVDRHGPPAPPVPVNNSNHRRYNYVPTENTNHQNTQTEKPHRHTSKPHASSEPSSAERSNGSVLDNVDTEFLVFGTPLVNRYKYAAPDMAFNYSEYKKFSTWRKLWWYLAKSQKVCVNCIHAILAAHC